MRTESGICENMPDNSEPQRAENRERLRTKREIAEICGVTTRTLEIWMKNGLIPYFKIGRTVRFKLDDVIEHLRTNRTSHV